MTGTNRKSTTTARRRAILTGAAAALAAGAVASMPANANAATDPTADAELIECCDEMFRIEMRHRRLFDEIEDDTERNRILEPDEARYSILYDRIMDLGVPRTAAGASALARAALADAQRHIDGTIMANGFAEEAAFVLCEFLNGGDVPEAWT